MVKVEYIQNLNDSILVEKLRKTLEHQYKTKQRDNGNIKIFVSDLCKCSRRKVFDMIYNKSYSLEDLYYFLIGDAIHQRIETVLMDYLPQLYDIEKDITMKDLVYGQPDLYDKINDVIIEIKSNVRDDIFKPFQQNLKQIMYYMAIANKKTGYLIYILYLTSKDKTDLNSWYKEFKIVITESERLELLKEIEQKAKKFKQALRNSDPSIAPHVYHSPEYNAECKNCEYRVECESMIGEEKYIKSIS